jgi:hypothetical protein
MAVVFDVLANDIVPNQCDVVVDDTVDGVLLNAIVDVTGLAFTNAATALGWFGRGDDALVQWIKPHLPYQFGQGIGVHTILLNWLDNLGALYPVAELSGSVLAIPSMCDTLDLPGGILLRTPRPADPLVTKFNLRLMQATCSVSMLNVPASLVGQNMAMQYFLMAQHFKALTL